MPKLSIIVPIYNAEKYLRRCLDSIRMQTFMDWECLLIDDGSTDSSGEICDCYVATDSRFCVIHQVNYGLVSARINGWKASNGGIIGFVDSDDWIEPDMYEHLMRAMQAEPKADIAVVGIFQECEGSLPLENRALPEYTLLSAHDAAAHMLTRRYFAWELWCKVYRRELFYEGAFLRELTVGEDLFTSWQLLKKAGSVLCLPYRGYHYRLHPESMSHDSVSIRIKFLQSLSAVKENMQHASTELKAYINILYIHDAASALLEAYLKKGLSMEERLWLQNQVATLMPTINGQILTKTWRHLLHFIVTDCTLAKFDSLVSKLYQRIIAFARDGGEIFIYGAGGGGQVLAEIMSIWNLQWQGFVVSDGQVVQKRVYGHPVRQLSEIKTYLQESIFLIGVSSRYAQEIKNTLHSYGVRNIYRPLFLRFLIDEEGGLACERDKLLLQTQKLLPLGNET